MFRPNRMECVKDTGVLLEFEAIRLRAFAFRGRITLYLEELHTLP